MPPPTATLRVGTVPYAVARPLDLGLEDEPGVELVREVPARLADRLRRGDLDVALVSSIELFRKPGYRYLRRLGVAGEGRVSSVQLFLRKPLDDVRRIALDPASRTSAVLLRAVLAAREGAAEIEYLEVAEDADPEQAEADGWLRIGDAALRQALGPDAPPTFNPSEAWREATGLPFVFAVWIARPEMDLEPWVGAFRRSRARGAAALDRLVEETAAQAGLDTAACHTYLAEECVYDLDPLRQGAALLAFRDRAAELDLCDGDLRPASISTGAPGPGGSR